MVFNFRIVSDEVSNFKREIQIDANATFLDLRNAICDSIGYRKDEMSSFFLCDDNWEKEKEITLEDMGTDSSEDAYIMDECILADYIDDEGQRLMFTFDYLNDRSFFIEMKNMLTGRDLLEPLCTLSLGTPPPQDLPLATAATTATTGKAAGKETTLDDFNDSLLEEEGYDPDELDMDGFSEMPLDE